MLEVFARVIEGSWLVMGQMGPYLLFGFATAGVLSVLISPAWIERNLGSAGFWPVFKASLFGVPLPLCSCSVIPVSASMRRHGASRGATAAFLLSTPQTGVDSIAVNLALLGPVFAVFRPLAALLTGVFGGLLVESVTGRVSDGDEESADEIADDEEKCHECCCSGKEPQSAIRRVISYSFVTLPADIGPALLLGVIIAGAISAYVEPNELKHFFENETLSILLMMVAAIPIYVCATASVPIAAGLILAGVSPGAALAFLIAGPATNAATLTTIWKMLGHRAAAAYLLTVAVGALVCGLALNWLAREVDLRLPPLGSACHEMEAVGWTTHFWAVTLLAVVAFSMIAVRWKKSG